MQNASIKTIKIKITNYCMNSCTFCIFHKRNSKLNIDNIVKIFSVVPNDWKGQILINGGEPTLHVDFIKMSEYIRKLYPENRLGLGTNLRLFEKSSKRIEEIFNAITELYDLFQIGCDLEHNNIDIVEKLVPVLRNKNKDVYINCLKDFSNEQIDKKLLMLDERYGSLTKFSSVFNHNENITEHNKNKKQLCKKRQRDILIDADGEIYFCFQQSFETSLGNIKNLSQNKLYSVFFETTIDYSYNACYKCSFYE